MVPFMKSKQGDEICVVCERNFRKDSKKPIPQLIIAEFVPSPVETPKPEEAKQEQPEKQKVQMTMAQAAPSAPLQEKLEAPKALDKSKDD